MKETKHFLHYYKRYLTVRLQGYVTIRQIFTCKVNEKLQSLTERSPLNSAESFVMALYSIRHSPLPLLTLSSIHVIKYLPYT